MHPAGEPGPADAGVDRILALFPEAARSEATAREMAERLEALSRARTGGERLDAWMELVEWTREDPALLQGARADAPIPEAATERLRLLVFLFEGTPELRTLVFDS